MRSTPSLIVDQTFATQPTISVSQLISERNQEESWERRAASFQQFLNSAVSLLRSMKLLNYL